MGHQLHRELSVTLTYPEIDCDTCHNQWRISLEGGKPRAQRSRCKVYRRKNWFLINSQTMESNKIGALRCNRFQRIPTDFGLFGNETVHTSALLLSGTQTRVCPLVDIDVTFENQKLGPNSKKIKWQTQDATKLACLSGMTDVMCNSKDLRVLAVT